MGLFKASMLLLGLTSTMAGAQVPATVLKSLRENQIPPAAASILVQELGHDRAWVSLNPRQARNPASVMKLVTTYAALELLGPAYRWRTEVYEDGPDLVLRGTGDPKLNYESFWMLLRNLRGRGMREIRGDVVLDRSYFAPLSLTPIDQELFRPYNVVPDALLVNFKSLRFVFVPEGEGVRIFVEPDLRGLELVNQLKTGNGSCPEGRAFRDLIQASFQSTPPRASFTGTYPLSCGERDLNVSLHRPEDYVEGMLRTLWVEMGGIWKGSIRDGVVPPSARLVYAHESEPLSEIVRDINKFSNNVMARQLFLTLGGELGGPPAQPEAAARAIAQWLTFKGIDARDLVLENGSGLSRLERASAETLMAILQSAWRSPVMPEFVASLPVVAADGTMRKRLHGEAVAGNAHVKTGLLSDARAMAGYVLDRAGRRHAVVMVVNHAHAPQAEAAFDALLASVRAATARGPARGGPRGGGPRRP